MRTPPLSAIEALMAAVETGSFRKAAEQLALSPSALSRRIQALEARLGEQLFDRSGPAVQLTEAGQRYLEAVQAPVRAIEAAGEHLRGDRERPELRLMAPRSLATAWLASTEARAVATSSRSFPASAKMSAATTADRRFARITLPRARRC